MLITITGPKLARGFKKSLVLLADVIQANFPSILQTFGLAALFVLLAICGLILSKLLS